MKLHVINLKRRADRWERCQKLPFEVERFEAIDGRENPLLSNKLNNGALHCAISHLFLLEKLNLIDEPFFLIGEDDLEIIDHGKIQHCIQEFLQLPYEVCNLGFDPRWMPVFGQEHKHVEEVIRGPTLMMHLYIIKKEAIPKFIVAIKFCIDAMMKGASLFSHACDHAWAHCDIRRCVPKGVRQSSDLICRQYESMSDIAIKDYVFAEYVGGLGNRLFVHAASCGLAEKLGTSVKHSRKFITNNKHGANETIIQLFRGTFDETQKEFIVFNERVEDCYKFIPFPSTINKNVLIRGYRQSEKYFPSNVQQLIPDWSILGEAREEIEKGVLGDTYSIHIRLGDYLAPEHRAFVIDLKNYFKKAMQKIPAGSQLRLFSDEPDKCKDIMAIGDLLGLKLSIASVRRDIETLYEMSLCVGGNIVANSSFSWWGAWFARQNGSKWATFPSKMGQGLPLPQDFIPDWGTRIEV